MQVKRVIMNKTIYYNAKKLVEPVIWLTALLILGFADLSSGTHISLCPLANLGFDFCPGCGLGHSVSYALRGNLAASFEAHPLGIFAIVVLLLRSFSLIRLYFQTQNK